MRETYRPCRRCAERSSSDLAGDLFGYMQRDFGCWNGLGQGSDSVPFCGPRVLKCTDVRSRQRWGSASGRGSHGRGGRTLRGQ